jgi:CHAD domain-containing protein
MAETVARTARRVLKRRAATFFACAKRAIGRGIDDELHRARIAGKRLRYNIEFFASQLGPERETALGLLALLQDKLGAIADARAFMCTYEALLLGLEPGDPRVTGLEARIAACRAQRADNISAVRALWRGDEHSPYPDMLAASLAAALGSSSKPA